jgi:pSer/pThr/pTyr-binding forkhead associated (FHA) protein
MDIVLCCTGGPCTGETITIDSELVLGREASERGRLGEDSRLSRRHARVYVDGAGRPMVEDLGSTNGTWINEQRLTDARIVSNGDVLRVGQTTFEIKVPVAPVATRVDTAVPVVAPPVVVPTVAEAPSPGPRLRVVAGPREGEEIPLANELLIGRSFGEPGALGGDKRLSRRHARIARGPGGLFFIEDTGSSNGTMINHVSLRRARVLRQGDQIEIGSSRLEALGLPSTPLAADLQDGEASAAPVRPLDAPATPKVAAAPPLAAPDVAAASGRPPQPALEGVPDAGAARGPQYVPQGAAMARLSSRRGRVVGVFAGVFAAAAVAAVAAVMLLAPLGTRTCPSGFVCQKPLTAPPLRAMTTVTGSLGWRLEYDARLVAPAKGTKTADGITLGESSFYDRAALGANPGSQLIGVLVQGYRTSQVSPQAAVGRLASLIDSHLVGTISAPTSDQLFGKPVLGFHPAVGEVLEGNEQTPQGPGLLLKLAVVSAASGGVTVAVAVAYPIQPGHTQQANPDRPYDQFGDQILETVRFPSDGSA